MGMPERDIVAFFRRRKQEGRKISLLTGYDFSFAQLFDEAGVDGILVGDSLANVILGLSDTKGVSFEEMLLHTQAVARGVRQAFVIADMPFHAYQSNTENAYSCAQRFLLEGQAQCVKLEWCEAFELVASQLVKAGIPVMAHIGFTPQNAEKFGKHKVQGKTREQASMLYRQAHTCQELGCFSIVLECIPDRVAEVITRALKIPTIGIGSGKNCDGQVLVGYDLLGFFKQFHPRFSRKYLDGATLVVGAVRQFCEDVQKETFPSDKETFLITDEEFQKFMEDINDAGG